MSSSEASDIDKVIKWRMQSIFASNSEDHKSAENFAARVKEMTNGRLEVKMYPVGSLTSTKGSFDAISKGVFEGHVSLPAYWIGKMQVAAFFCSLPYGLSKVQDWIVWYYQLGGLEMAREAYAKHNIYFVGPIVCVGGTPIFSNKPIRTLGDFKGLKIRTKPGAEAHLMEDFHASPTFLPIEDVYTALETGVLDAVSGYSLEGWHKFGIHETTKYMIWPPILSPAASLEVCVNMKAWSNLPEDIKTILNAAVHEYSNNANSLMHLNNHKALKDLRSNNMEEFTLPPSDVVKITKAARDGISHWASEDPSANKVWKSQLDYLNLIEE